MEENLDVNEKAEISEISKKVGTRKKNRAKDMLILVLVSLLVITSVTSVFLYSQVSSVQTEKGKLENQVRDLADNMNELEQKLVKLTNNTDGMDAEIQAVADIVYEYEYNGRPYKFSMKNLGGFDYTTKVTPVNGEALVVILTDTSELQIGVAQSIDVTVYGEKQADVTDGLIRTRYLEYDFYLIDAAGECSFQTGDVPCIRMAFHQDETTGSLFASISNTPSLPLDVLENVDAMMRTFKVGMLDED